ncbi:MAG TPA: glycine cleavage system aminomethyltransferase GcvT, partial [Sphingomonas sp.]
MTISIPDDDAVEPTPEALPLDAWHRARGARMVPFAGYEMPIQYEGIMPEHLWTREHAGLFDVSHMGQLVFGAETPDVDVDSALEALIPADLKSLLPGRQRYSLLLGDAGGILDDLMISRLPCPSPFAYAAGPDQTGIDRFYMVVNGATKWDDIAHLREHLADEIVINHMDEQALLALQGPEAATALARLAPGVEALTFMTAGAFEIAGVPAWISRSGYTGEDGFEISIPAEAAERVADALGTQPEVKPIGLGARDSLRLEAGLPLYGHDLDEQTSPIAADLGFALSRRRREEGGFPGHARIMAERAAGPKLRRVGLIVEGRQPVREGATVAGGGRVTSG